MNNVSGAGTASQLIYIPTDSDLNGMTFSSDANKSEYKSFIESDKYLKNHRGEYMKRNAITAPWLNRFNLKVAEDFYLNVAGKKHTLEISADVNNLGNLINNSWGIYKQISSTSILSYANGTYTFTKPEWSNYNDISSTWQMLFSVRYSF